MVGRCGSVLSAAAAPYSCSSLARSVQTILTFVHVVLRYGFNSGFIWTLEADFYDTPRWVMHDGTTLTCSVRQ
jgi:hypothetical protein